MGVQSTRCTFPPPPTSSCDTLRPPIRLPRLSIASPIIHHEARSIRLQRMDMHRHLRLAIVILSAIGSMFAKGHHTMMGSEEDPKDGGKVAAAVFGAVAVYGAFLVFCGLQALLHKRQSRQGEIALR